MYWLIIRNAIIIYNMPIRQEECLITFIIYVSIYDYSILGNAMSNIILYI